MYAYKNRYYICSQKEREASKKTRWRPCVPAAGARVPAAATRRCHPVRTSTLLRASLRLRCMGWEPDAGRLATWDVSTRRRCPSPQPDATEHEKPLDHDRSSDRWLTARRRVAVAATASY